MAATDSGEKTKAAAGRMFVYVSNAEDGNIATYRMERETGVLQPGPRVSVAPMVMPMTVSHDRRFLFVAVRSKPFSVVTLSIDSPTGALAPLACSRAPPRP